MEELIKELIEEQKKTNDLLRYSNQGKDPFELLTIEQVKKETGFGLGTVQKMFKDPELPVQRYTTPFKVTRKAINDYTSVSHDQLSERS